MCDRRIAPAEIKRIINKYDINAKRLTWLEVAALVEFARQQLRKEGIETKPLAELGIE